MIRRAALILLTILVVAATPLREPSVRAARITGGSFTPQYGPGGAKGPILVSPFRLDRNPVTNADYSRFVGSNPAWAPGVVSPIFADGKYLEHWTDGLPLATDRNRPVVNVSWFAAAAYCRAAGGFLPTTVQWEFAAAASERSADASADPAFVQQLLTWYSTPTGEELSETPSGAPNYWGVFNMHGLVWEWTEDFNSVFISGDNRRDGESLKNVFCGSGGESAADKANYAAFMRYALRSSLKGEYTTPNLGFRCAYRERRG